MHAHTRSCALRPDRPPQNLRRMTPRLWGSMGSIAPGASTSQHPPVPRLPFPRYAKSQNEPLVLRPNQVNILACQDTCSPHAVRARTVEPTSVQPRREGAHKSQPQAKVPKARACGVRAGPEKGGIQENVKAYLLLRGLSQIQVH